jgi:hypothetical protein
LLRLRTGVRGRVDEGPCPVCGRTSPRVVLDHSAPALRSPRLVEVLDRTPEVIGWQAELRTVGGADELIVHLAVDGGNRRHPGRVLRTLDRELAVTQFVVVSPDELEARLGATGYQRVLDTRR